MPKPTRKSPKKTAKAQTSPEKFNRANSEIGSYNVRPTFDHRLAVNEFGSWVYAAATLNADAMASVPIRLYVKERVGTRSLLLNNTETKRLSRKTKSYLLGDSTHRPSHSVLRKAVEWRDGFVEATWEHPVLRVLRDVNSNENGYNFAYLRHLYLELCGNAYIHPILGASGVNELYSLYPPGIEIVPGKLPSDPLIMGYSYGLNKERLVFAPDEVIHFKRSNPKDKRQLYGIGNVEACWNAIKTIDSAEDYRYHLYSNYARSDMAFLFSKDVQQEELNRQHLYLAQQLRKKNRPERHLTMAGVDEIVPLNFPPKQLPVKEELVELIASCFKIPVQLLTANDSILSNLENGIKLWREIAIAPALIRDEETLNQTFLPLFGPDIAANSFLAYDNCIPEDKAFERDTLIAYVNSGIITKNEAREQLGYEPLEEEPVEETQPFNQPETTDEENTDDNE